MKKLSILYIFSMFYMAVASANTSLDGKSIEEYTVDTHSKDLSSGSQTPYIAYAELLGFEKGFFSKKVTVRVDIGQNNQRTRDMKLVDEDGKDLVFNSMVDAMNYMGNRGWSFLQAYAVTHGQSHVYHWLLTKEVTDDSQITEGFQLRAETKDMIGTYSITYLKKNVKASQWDVVKEDSDTMTKKELQELIDAWKNQSTNTIQYDLKIKKID